VHFCRSASSSTLIPALRAGHDALIAAAPGSGASSGVLLGLLIQLLSTQRLLARNKALPLAVVLCPAREHAQQTAALAASMAAGTQLTVRCATGGSDMAEQVLQLRRGADLLVATPGRLLDLLDRKCVSLARCRHLVWLGVPLPVWLLLHCLPALTCHHVVCCR
jgi:superfamily II DNA/RNA helicase